MNDYDILKQLGVGGSGTTWVASRKRDKKKVVIKQIVTSSIDHANFALNEAKTLQFLHHPGVVRYEDVFLHKESEKGELAVCIVMEYCAGGDLRETIHYYVTKNQPIPEDKICRWMMEISQALVYVHGCRMTHRDVKGMNVFLAKDGTLKLGDFGVARQVTNEMKSKVGTPCYFAPEVLQTNDYGPPADVWAAGCIALEMVTRSFLWYRKGLLGSQIMTEPVTVDNLPSNYSPKLKRLVAKMLDPAAHRRPSSKQCMDEFSDMVQGSAAALSEQPTVGSDRLEEMLDGMSDAVLIAKNAAEKAAQAATRAISPVAKEREVAEKPEQPNFLAPNGQFAVGISTAWKEADPQIPEDAGAPSETKGYNLVRNGVEVFVSEADLLRGMAPIIAKVKMEYRNASPDQIIGAALRNREFFLLYVGSEDKRELVAGKMRSVLKDWVASSNSKARRASMGLLANMPGQAEQQESPSNRRVRELIGGGPKKSGSFNNGSPEGLKILQPRQAQVAFDVPMSSSAPNLLTGRHKPVDEVHFVSEKPRPENETENPLAFLGLGDIFCAPCKTEQVCGVHQGADQYSPQAPPQPAATLNLLPSMCLQPSTNDPAMSTYGALESTPMDANRHGMPNYNEARRGLYYF